MKRLVAIVLCTVMSIGLFSCGSCNKYEVVWTDVFDTESSLTVYCKSQSQFDEINNRVHEMLIKYHKSFDIYNQYNENNIMTINLNAGKVPVKVNDSIIELLSFGIEAYKDYGGVNIAMGSVLSLWHDARENETAPPTEEQLNKAAEHMDVDNIIIDTEKNTVYIKDSLEAIDVGAIAKGYAAQKAADYLKTLDITGAMISLGGNVCTIGKKQGEKSFRVAVQDPDLIDYAAVLNIKNLSVVTSGDYQRYYDYEGKRYHHIIDSDTLQPAAYSHSVTVICDDSAKADALSTALFVMPIDKGQRLVDSLDGVEAMWILSDDNIVYSQGFKAYEEK